MAREELGYGTGRRKTSTARVHLYSGTGAITANGKPVSEYFQRDVLEMVVNQPFKVANVEGRFDVDATIDGGGKSGQAGALLHGISRALCEADPNLRGPLKKAGFLTRDPRMVERKKYGRPGARKRFQFSKR